MIEMKVAGIALDAATRSPIVLLKDGTDRRALPIYIGQDQAKAIISALENQTPPRPLTLCSDRALPPATSQLRPPITRPALPHLCL